jgi:hypothetical protein
MASDIRVIHVRDFIRATVSGKFDLKSSEEALKRIANEASTSPDVDILIDVREAPANLTLAQLTQLVEEFHRLRVGAGHKTAVLTAKERFDNAHFFAVTARGRGRNVQAFISFEEAFDWLTL